MASSDRQHLEQLFVKMHAVIRAIPRGHVATYGQVAELAGLPGGARVAAASLKGKNATGLPWQRVIGKASPKRGRIKILDPVGAAIQRQLLEKEGVIVGDEGLVKLDVFGWLPGATPRAKNQAKKRASKARPRTSASTSARRGSSRRARTGL